MRKFLKFLVIGILTLCCLTSCSEAESAPEGLATMQIREGDGFKLYCPEGWSEVSAPFNENEYVYAAKLSSVTTTSFTFVETDMPEGELGTYFRSSLEELSSDIRESLELLVENEKCNFGDANSAYKFVYTYQYDAYDYDTQNYIPTDFSFMQIFVIHEGRFFIFTYTAKGLPTDEAGEYASYLDEIQLVIDNFTITGEGNVNTENKEYEKDADGYNLVSDKTVCGFSLYLPDEYTVIDNNGNVEAKISANASLSLTKATQTGSSIVDYWTLRKIEIQRFASDLVEIDVNRANKEGEEISVVLGDLGAYKVASYEYTYKYNGVTYHVYQVMGVDNFNGYVFTYTATEDEYESHIDTIKTILEKVRF